MKTFNKRKIFFFKFLILVILSLVFPVISFAQISKIVFTTEPQIVKPNEVSGKITIQSQDVGGNSFKTPETLDLEFISTSATGEFLNSTGNSVTTYMSKNTANRSFYYRDSILGNFTITINAKGRESGKKWSANQIITVSDSSSGNNSSLNNSGEVLGTSSNLSSLDSQSSGGESSTNVSSPNAKLEIFAGNNRMTSPGSPIWFQATVKKNTTKTGIELNWSFGDGNVGVGTLVSHTYKYSGNYVVVLNAKAGDIFSVSRLRVRVIKPNIVISEKDKYLEISNNSNTEINLFNWKIENKGKGFIFQPNTIILPHSSIKFDKSLLKMSGYDNSLGTSLKNSLKEEVFVIAPVKKANLSEILKNLKTVKKEFFTLQKKAKKFGLVAQNNNFNNQPINSSHLNLSKINTVSVILANKNKENQATTTNAENIIYEAPKQESFILKLTNFIKRVFFN